MTLSIIPASIPEQLSIVKQLFTEYTESLGIDLGFQGFETELATLPGKYAAPSGQILLAQVDGVAVGCVALRAMDKANSAEMKRLYVQPSARGLRLGEQLAVAICDQARQKGYSYIYLDTLTTMPAAVALYEKLGFEPTEAYIYNPLPDVQYYRLVL